MTPKEDTKKNGNVSYKMLAGWLVIGLIALSGWGWNATGEATATKLETISQAQSAITDGQRGIAAKQEDIGEAVSELKVFVAVLSTKVETLDASSREIRGDIREIKKKLK